MESNTFIDENFLGEIVFHMLLDCTFERARALIGIPSLLCKEIHS